MAFRQFFNRKMKWESVAIQSGGGGGGGGFALVQQLQFSPNGGGLTTGATNFSGSDLIVIFAGTYKDWTVSSITDSNSNVYLPCTLYSGGAQAGQFFYCRNPVGSLSSLTFTITGVSGNIIFYSFFEMMGFSGGATSTLDQQSGTLNSIIPFQPGSVTPSQSNALIVSAIFNYNAGESPTCAEMTSVYGVAKSGNIGMGGAGYIVQSSATAINPTWVSPSANGSENAIVIASFIP